jgi:serine protease Do
MKAGILSIAIFGVVSLLLPPAFSQATRAQAYSLQAGPTSYLGIGVVEVNPDSVKKLNLKDVRGAVVAHVDENGPAAKAGIREDDVVLEYNGTPVEGVEQFVRMVRETPVGRSVKMVIWRSGAAQSLTVTVGERQGAAFNPPGAGGGVQIPPFPQMPQMPQMPSIEIPRFQMAWQSSVLGIEGESLAQERQFAEFFGVKDGVLVKQVMRNTPAEKAGLKAGDVITKVNGMTVGSTRDISAQLRSRSNRTLTLTVVRDKHEMPVTVTLDQIGSASPNPAEPPADRF